MGVSRGINEARLGHPHCNWPLNVFFLLIKEFNMVPKVLVSDKLSETAIKIFENKGIEVDFMPEVGKDKEKLAKIIGNYDGLAIRSATRVTPTILRNANKLKVIGRAGIGTDNIDKEEASKGIM